MASAQVAPLAHGNVAQPSTESATVTVRATLRCSPPELVTEYTSTAAPSTPGFTVPDTRTAAVRSPSIVSLATAPGSTQPVPASCVTAASPSSASVSALVLTSHVAPPHPSVHAHVKPPMVSVQAPCTQGVGTQPLTVSATVTVRVADAELPCALATWYDRVYTPGTARSTAPATSTRSAGSGPSNGSVAVKPGSAHVAVADASAVTALPPVSASVGNTWFCLSHTSPSHRSSQSHRCPPTRSLQAPWPLHGSATTVQPSAVSTTCTVREADATMLPELATWYTSV